MTAHPTSRPGQQRPAAGLPGLARLLGVSSLSGVPLLARLSAMPVLRRLSLPRLTTVLNWWRAHPLLADAVFAVALFAVVGGRQMVGYHGVVDRLLAVGMCLPLVWRRRYPLRVYAVLCVVALVQWFLTTLLVADTALLVGLYTVAATCRRLWAVLAFEILEIGIGLAVMRIVPINNWPEGYVLLSGMALAAFVLGVNIQTRRAYLVSLEDRARRAEHERDQQALIAAAGERARIAREMHDVIAHNLSVMIALADGAAFAVRTGAVEAESAARQVSATGRQALAEMHRLLGVLRDDDGQDASRAPQPRIDQLDELIAQVRSAGLNVALTVAGEPFDLPVTAEVAVYRVAQEALTNVLKHARGPGRATVRLCYAEPVVDLEITDDGLAQPDQRHVEGHGLTGMRERAALYGGQLHAGPMSGGGWRVALRLDTGTVLTR